MSNQKHKYEVEINSIETKAYKYSFKYGQTKNCFLYISEKGILISAEIGAKYDAEDLLMYDGYKLFPEALKKGLLLHLLFYSSELSIEHIVVRIDGKEFPQINTLKPLVSTMIEGNLCKTITSEKWRDQEIAQEIISHSKSSEDRRYAALYAYIISKTKTYESERFVYLWMAFNGLYGYVSNCIESYKESMPSSKKKRKIGDGEGIGYLMAIYGYAKEMVTQAQNKKIAPNVEHILKEWDGVPITQETLESKQHKSINSNIKLLLIDTDKGQIDVLPYGYLLGFYSYYYRCNLIHANKPLPLYSCPKEPEIKNIKLINQMIENFLDTELYKYFDPEYINNSLQSRIEDVLHDKSIKLNLGAV